MTANGSNHPKSAAASPLRVRPIAWNRAFWTSVPSLTSICSCFSFSTRNARQESNLWFAWGNLKRTSSQVHLRPITSQSVGAPAGTIYAIFHLNPSFPPTYMPCHLISGYAGMVSRGAPGLVRGRLQSDFIRIYLGYLELLNCPGIPLFFCLTRCHRRN